MMKSRRCLHLAVLLLASCIAPWTACPLFAQTTPAAATASHVDANVIPVSVTVRDKHGDLVPNLTKDDFTLIADARPATITYLTHNVSLPLTLGLLVETSISQRNFLDSERGASQHFLDQMLAGPGDKAFLIQFDREVDLLADVSSDKSKLHAALDQLGAPQFSNTGYSQDSGESGHRLGGSGTPLYDAIYLASNEVMKKQPYRKVLIVLTDGVDRGSKETLFSTIEAAQRANTAVYAIYFKGQEQPSGFEGAPARRRGGMGYPGGGYPGGGGGWPGGNGGGSGRSGRPTEGSRIDGRKVLEQICSETGGYMFQVDKKKSVDQMFSMISDELHAQYTLGYTPDKQSAVSGYHKITLTAKKKGLYVQVRQGYYAGE